MDNGKSIKLGDYNVSKSVDGGYITVSDESTGWHVQFSEGIMMFHAVESIMEGDDAETVIGALVDFWFVQTTFVFDEEYMSKVWELTKGFSERFKERMKEVSQEEVEAVIKASGIEDKE